MSKAAASSASAAQAEDDQAAQAAYLAAQAARPSEHALPPPGTFEQLHREARDTLATHHVFRDAKFEMTKPVSSALQVTHRFVLGEQPSYSFSALLMGAKGFVMAETDTGFNVSGRGQYMVTPGWTAKAQTQLTSQGDAYIGEVEYAEGDQSANLKFVNPRLLDGAGVLSASYLQSLSRRLVLGSELTVQRDRQGRVGSGLTFATRYSGADYMLTANVTSNGGLLATYFQRVNEQVTIAAELEGIITHKQRDAAVTLGAKFDLRMSTIRAQIDTMGRVAAVLEHRLQPTMAVNLSAELDHLSGNSRFGVGLTLS